MLLCLFKKNKICTCTLITHTEIEVEGRLGAGGRQGGSRQESEKTTYRMENEFANYISDKGLIFRI